MSDHQSTLVGGHPCFCRWIRLQTSGSASNTVSYKSLLSCTRAKPPMPASNSSVSKGAQAKEPVRTRRRSTLIKENRQELLGTILTTLQVSLQ